ncbi:MAG: hypothetical protein ACRER8_23305 [Pseudomonas sp.]|uniref:hypothetical protein n=1 Tax=Pseudomonas sp. TaxID=306 RepID=UPI003D6FC4A9
MESETTFEHEEKIYTSIYNHQEDNLMVYLPDGTQRTTALRGLDPEQAAMTHLRAFVLHSTK